MPRGQLIMVLVIVEACILGAMIASVRPEPSDSPLPAVAASLPAGLPSGSRLIEGGSQRSFEVGSRPAVTVDIGYADLTIRTADQAQIDVSLSRDTSLGMFRSRVPITAIQDSQTIRIAKANETEWSPGDDRRLTLVVPPATRVTVENAGDIRVEGLRADAFVNSVGNGDITVSDYDGPSLRVTSHNGLISLRSVTAEHLEINSSNDRVEATGLQARDGSIDADDRITLGITKASNTLVSAEASDGKIDVLGFSAEPPVNDEDTSRRTIRIGDGTGHLSVRSNSGNIQIDQED